MTNSNTIRLFTGTFINKEIFSDAYNEIRSEINKYFTGKLVEYNNLHFTWQFIGDFPLKEIASLKSSLKENLCTHENSLIIRGITAFPNTSRPRIIVVPVISEDNIVEKIYNSTSMKLRAFGIEADLRKFTPHVTLMRIKENRSNDYKLFFDKFKNREFGLMNSFSYQLISSELTRTGPIYKIIS
jgi:2'-5' RNA ligase